MKRLREIRRYYRRHGRVVSIAREFNLLDQRFFVTVTFENGKYVTLCRRAKNEGWFRHDGGGRYGQRRLYTNL